MTAQATSRAGDGGEISTGELIRGAWRDRYWILAILVVAIALAGLVIAFMQPVYRATVIALPAESKQQAGGLGGLLGQLGGVASAVGIDLPAAGNHFESLALIESRGFLVSFVEKKNLRPVLFADRWDPGTQSWAAGMDEPTPDEAARQFGESVLTIAEDKRTGIITISIDWHDRELAAEWANGLVRELNAELRQRAAEEARRTLAYLDQEIKKTESVEMREVLFKLVENQLRSRMLANVKEDFALKVVDWARVPSPGEPVRPQRAVLIGAALVVGLFVGFAFTASRSLRLGRQA